MFKSNHRPVLQKRTRTANGTRTIAGVGERYGWVASVEMDAAIKMGYNFKIIKGYKFRFKNIFKGFVTTLFELRLQYKKDNPLNLIAKLLMNSLYGRFGMRVHRMFTEIFNLDNRQQHLELAKLVKTVGESIVDIVKLDQRNVIILRDMLPDFFTKDNDFIDYTDFTDTSIAIAAWITACARVVMAKFKNRPDYKIYYTDTDSVVLDRPLPANLIGTGLGQLKLEHVI